MLGWAARALLILASSIASWFVSKDALNFDVIQMVIAVGLFTLLIMIAAFWKNINHFIRRLLHKDKQH
ncbi:MAG: hypothetical protein PSV35_01290 [bacterium]|nr:hypothetical protein [bacterium]